MKPLLISLFALLALTAVQADTTYGYLLFKGTDGTPAALSVAELEMTVAGGQLVAVNAAGTRTFSLKDLATMQFSETAPSGIATSRRVDGPVAVTTPSGVQMGTFGSLKEIHSKLSPGIYLVKQGSETFKTVVR